MATGAVPASLMGLKSRERGLGFVKRMDFVRVSDLQRVKFRRTKILVISNQSSGSDIAELQPASKGSTLLVPRQKYCESIHKTVRRKTRTVMVGNVAIGSEHPIRVQTMTTTDTKDVNATVEQVMRISDMGLGDLWGLLNRTPMCFVYAVDAVKFREESRIVTLEVCKHM